MMKNTLTIALLVMGTAAMAQNAPAPANVVPISQGKTIAAAVADMATAADALAAVDPAITGNVSAVTAKLSLETGLASIATANHLEWRKVYLPAAQIPKNTDGTVDAVKLKAMVEAAVAVPQVTIGVVEPGKNTVAMTTRAVASAPATAAWLKDKTPVYLLYRPTPAVRAASGDAIADYLGAQKASLETYKNMTPEQRTAAAKQGLEMMMNMDPSMMGQMAQDSMKAMQSLTPDEKAKLMDMSMQMMHPNTP
jgi:hypothetical protein